jgi:hypothetical protein
MVRALADRIGVLPCVYYPSDFAFSEKTNGPSCSFLSLTDSNLLVRAVEHFGGGKLDVLFKTAIF